MFLWCVTSGKTLNYNFSPRFPSAPLWKWCCNMRVQRNRNIYPEYGGFQLHFQPWKLNLTAKKEMIARSSSKAPDFQESESLYAVLHKGMAALGTASVAASQARQQHRCCQHFPSSLPAMLTAESNHKTHPAPHLAGTSHLTPFPQHISLNISISLWELIYHSDKLITFYPKTNPPKQQTLGR